MRMLIAPCRRTNLRQVAVYTGGVLLLLLVVSMTDLEWQDLWSIPKDVLDTISKNVQYLYQDKSQNREDCDTCMQRQALLQMEAFFLRLAVCHGYVPQDPDMTSRLGVTSYPSPEEYGLAGKYGSSFNSLPNGDRGIDSPMKAGALPASATMRCVACQNGTILQAAIGKGLSSQEISRVLHFVAMRLQNESYFYGLSTVKNTAANYTYKASVTITLDKTLTLHIDERHLSVPTGGGAGFRVEIFGNTTRRLLSLRDHMNGSYTASCNMELLECVQINVTLQYTNFTQFSQDKILSHNVHLERLCPDDKGFSPVNNSLDNAIYPMKYGKCRFVDFGSKTPVWNFHLTHDKRTRKFGFKKWTPVHLDCRLPVFTSSEVRRCSERFTSLTMVGDSHSRYAFYYILSKLGLLDPRKTEAKSHSKVTSGRFTFEWKPNPRDILNYLESLLNSSQSTPLTHHDVITLNTGNHPISMKVMLDYFIPMEKVYAALYKLKGHPRWQNARFVWLDTVPLLEYEPRYMYRMWFNGTRSNHAIAAANALVAQSMAELGVEVFSTFDWIYPHVAAHANARCVTHYLCWDTGANYVDGWMGYNVMDAFFRRMCYS